MKQDIEKCKEAVNTERPALPSMTKGSVTTNRVMIPVLPRSQTRNLMRLPVPPITLNILTGGTVKEKCTFIYRSAACKKKYDYAAMCMYVSLFQ